MTVIIALLVLVVCGALIARWVRVSRQQRILDSSIPLSSAAVPTHDVALWGAGTVTVLDALWQYARIDPALLNAMDTAHGANAFDSYAELTRHVEDVAGRGVESWAGMVSQYKGYLGEQVLAENLRDAGHHVAMASVPNQEGWDALLDGQPVNFKVGLEASGITNHLADHPDIPVVTVSEHAETLAGNEMVTALPDVSGEAIGEATESSLEGIDGLGDVDFHFPVITAVVSGAANLRLLIRGDTDLQTAVVYTAADVIGVGAGGWAGMKAGMLLGSSAGPLGFVLGVIAGGIAGALGGRLLAKVFKERGLRRAQGQLRRTMIAYAHGYVEALSIKAGGLVQYADWIRPRRFLWWAWPRLSEAARSRCAKLYRQWAERCRWRAAWVSIRLRGDDEEAHGQLAQYVLTAEGMERAYSPTLADIERDIKGAANSVEAELRKLGYVDSQTRQAQQGQG